MATVHGKLVQEAWKSDREWGRKSFDFLLNVE